MTRPSIRDLVLLAPRPLRKFVRYRVLPSGVAERLGRAVDGARRPFLPQKQERSNGAAIKLHSAWLAGQMWNGSSEPSIRQLEAMIRDPRTSSGEASEAARQLGVWYASHQDYERAYELSVIARLAGAKREKKELTRLLEADCLLELNKVDEAAALVDMALHELPNSPSIWLTKANVLLGEAIQGGYDREDERLSWINKVFLERGYAPLQRIDPTRPLSMDNITSHAPPCRVPLQNQPKISILMPTFGAAETLRIAIAGILNQTWQNLEIVIVDDQSKDDTFELAQELSRQDSRIRAFQLPKNSGAYAARNEGLRQATGEYVTVHDADDWSHPQKLEAQIQRLLDEPHSPANGSCWVRCRWDLMFRGSARYADAERIVFNHSSLMLKRKRALELGGWDEVRVAADSEFVRRLERAHGLYKVDRVEGSVPLSFALHSTTSLTRVKVSHIYTIWHGVRGTYHDASMHWLDTRGPACGYALPPASAGRAFPAPREILPYQEPEVFDLLFIMDFGLKGNSYWYALNYVSAAIKSGKKVAIFNWRRFGTRAKRRPNFEIMELAQRGQLYIVSASSEVKAKVVVAAWPSVLSYKIDRAPQVQTERFYIVANQLLTSPVSGDLRYDPAEVSQNIFDLFGLEPEWIPVSEAVRKLMVESGSYERIHDTTWTPVIDPEALNQTPVVYSRNKRKLPVVGRYAQDRISHWPNSAEAIGRAYCVDRPADVRLLGGAEIAKTILGTSPKNWTVFDFEELEPQALLRDLDFYIHYPHEDHIEEFGSGIIEAMTLGIPVILPPAFESTYGDGAIYAEPDRVWEVLESIWLDESLWTARSQAGIRFVRDHYDWTEAASRIAMLTD